MADPHPERLQMSVELVTKNVALVEKLNSEIATAQGPLKQALQIVAQFLSSMGSMELEDSSTENFFARLHFLKDIPSVMASITKAAQDKQISSDSLPLIKMIQEHLGEMVGWIQQSVTSGGSDSSGNGAA